MSEPTLASVQRVLAALAVALLAASLAGLAVVSPAADENDAGSTPTPTSTTVPPLTPGRARVTGTLTNMTAFDARGDAVTPPFTITVPEAGRGGLTLPGVEVDGQPQTIEWSGGRPLPVTGRGGLNVDATTVNVDANGIYWALDGAPRLLDPGTYTLGSTVAVGSAARDRVAFRAGDGDGLQTRGGATAVVTPRPIRIESPRGTLELRGTLTVETATVTRPLPTLRFGPGTYVVELTPVPGGYTINASLDGALAG